MRISDWSSDVCSSDLAHRIGRQRIAVGRAQGHGEAGCTACTRWLPGIPLRPARRWRQRGREWRLSVLGTRHCRSSRGLSPGQPGTEADRRAWYLRFCNPTCALPRRLCHCGPSAFHSLACRYRYLPSPAFLPPLPFLSLVLFFFLFSVRFFFFFFLFF